MLVELFLAGPVYLLRGHIQFVPIYGSGRSVRFYQTPSPLPPKRTVIGVCWLPHRAHHRHRTQILATSDVTCDTVFQDRNAKTSQKVYYLVN